MTCVLKKYRPPSRMLRILMCREVVAVMLMLGIAFLTWTLVHDRGILFPYRDQAVNQHKQMPLYDHGDLQHETVTLEDLQ